LNKRVSVPWLSHRLWAKLGLLVLLGLAIHWLLPMLASLEHSWQVFVTLTPWAVGMALLAQLFSYIASGYMMQALLGLTSQQIRLWRSTLIFLGAASIGLAAGGMVGSSAAIYLWANDQNGNPEGATLASLVPGYLNNLILALIAILGLVHLFLVHNLTQVQLIGFGATVLIIAVITSAVGLALRYRDQAVQITVRMYGELARLRRKPYDPEGTRATMEKLYAAWGVFRRGAWRKPVLGAFLSVVFDMLTLYFMFIAAGHTVSAGVLMTGYGLPLLLGKVAFVVPGGIGVVEASMVAMYTGLGIPQPIAVVVVLGYRFISFWIPTILGFPVATYLQRHLSLNTERKQVSDATR